MSQDISPRAPTPPGPYSYTIEKRAAQKPENEPSRSQLDPVFGQTGAFPESRDADGETEPDEGLQYLRAVRSEAMGMASIMTAPSQVPAQVDGRIDWFDDGAYIAPSFEHAKVTIDEQPQVHAMYSRALCQRFEHHRNLLNQPPPANKLASLDQNLHPTTIPRMVGKKTGYKFWKPHLRGTDPVPIQVCSMDRRTVLRLLGFIEAMLRQMRAGQNITPALSTWVWALLGRVGDVGLLATDEVGAVRSLAKTAIQLTTRYRMKALRDQDSDAEYSSDDDDINNDEHEPKDTENNPTDQDGSPEKQLEPDMVPSLNSLATLELIVIVAGEFYGQKDLLQARSQFWGVDM